MNYKIIVQLSTTYQLNCIYYNLSVINHTDVSYIAGTKNGTTLTVKLHHTTMAHIIHLP